ncbi:MAG: DUF1059 domain-containing protein [Alphaproteobacteria bacterium]|nr:DUF1059 domain-containing protein [Alphaproteobacteria bacterium]
MDGFKPQAQILGQCPAVPGYVAAETEDEVWKLMELHAVVAHGEDPSAWSDDDRAFLKTLIKPA